jgi:hypothetical protein
MAQEALDQCFRMRSVNEIRIDDHMLRVESPDGQHAGTHDRRNLISKHAFGV